MPFVSLRLQKDLKMAFTSPYLYPGSLLFIWFQVLKRKKCTWSSQLFLLFVLFDV